jgi:hypothetical protein
MHQKRNLKIRQQILKNEDKDQQGRACIQRTHPPPQDNLSVLGTINMLG